MKTTLHFPDVTAEWLDSMGFKRQSSGAWTAFSDARAQQSDSPFDPPIVWVNFRVGGETSLALVTREKQMSKWMGYRSRDEIVKLVEVFGLKGSWE